MRLSRELLPRKSTYLSSFLTALLTIPRHESDISAVRLYLTYCNAQPLLLFNERTSATSLETRDPEILFAVQALGMRFGGGGLTGEHTQLQIRQKTDRACQLVMARLAGGAVELSTIQVLCLLSILDFTGRSIHQSLCYYLTLTKL